MLYKFNFYHRSFQFTFYERYINKNNTIIINYKNATMNKVISYEIWGTNLKYRIYRVI